MMSLPAPPVVRDDVETGQSISHSATSSKSITPELITLGESHTEVSWTSFQKWQTISTACVVCFAVSIDSTAILSASEEVCHDFNIDQKHFSWSVFLLTSWTAAAAVLPLFVYPLMEDFGVRKIYLATFLLFLLSVAIEAVAPTFAGLIIARLFAGAAGGVLQNAVDGIATDLWHQDVRRRACSLTLYITALMSGIIGGSVFGGVIGLSIHWRWIFYIELMAFGILLPYIYFTLGEPRPRRECIAEATGKPRLAWIELSQMWATLRITLTRGIHMLFSEFIVATFTLWSSFAFGTVFMLAASIPQVCMTIYGWSEAQGGIFSTPFLLGALLGGVACCIHDLLIYPLLTAKQTNPEARLYLAVPATLVGIVAGILIYAWSATPSTDWIVLAFALGMIGFGVTCVVTAVAVYVTDCYAIHAASAISAVAFGENCFAAFLPLATRDMYTRLGYKWAGTLLGTISLLVCLAPIMLIVFGKRIRSRSQYLNGTKLM